MTHPRGQHLDWFNLLDLLADWLGLPNLYRVLLAGTHGVGKSSWAFNNMKAGADTERVALNADSGPEDLLGTWTLVDGNTVFAMGPAARAWVNGVPLVIDEVDKGSSSVVTVLHALLDDAQIAKITLPTGEVIRPAEGFCAFATMNGVPSALPQALLDRFELVLTANTVVPAATEQLAPDAKETVVAYYAQLARAYPQPAYDLSFRRLVAQQKIEKALEKAEYTNARTESFHVVFGKAAKEIMSVVENHGVKLPESKPGDEEDS